MGSADASPDSPVTAVLVTFNSRDHIVASIESLSREQQGIPIDVVVVDNGSTDGTAALVESHGRARVVCSKNLGYAAGVNTGVRESSGRGPILVLNPDTECLPGSVAIMVATAAREHAVVAPRLLDADGQTSPSIRRAPTLRRGMSLAFTGLPAFTERVEVGPEYESAGPIDWATGAALLVPRAVPRAARWVGRVLLHVLRGDRLLPPRERPRVAGLVRARRRCAAHRSGFGVQ